MTTKPTRRGRNEGHICRRDDGHREAITTAGKQKGSIAPDTLTAAHCERPFSLAL
jgi:hypothetical protein